MGLEDVEMVYSIVLFTPELSLFQFSTRSARFFPVMLFEILLPFGRAILFSALRIARPFSKWSLSFAQSRG